MNAVTLVVPRVPAEGSGPLPPPPWKRDAAADRIWFDARAGRPGCGILACAAAADGFAGHIGFLLDADPSGPRLIRLIEWAAVVDNLTRGRFEWVLEDPRAVAALFPGGGPMALEEILAGVWRSEDMEVLNGDGKRVPIRIYPRVLAGPPRIWRGRGAHFSGPDGASATTAALSWP